MRITLLLLLLTFEAQAQNKPRIEVLPNPQSIEDFDHEFKGCPENSECDQIMGHMLNNWKEMIKRLKALNDSTKVGPALELYRSKYGIPVEIYTTHKAQASFRPAIHSSNCKEHNPKSGEKILRATLFIKSLSTTKALIWRDQSQIELPVIDHLMPQPVTVFYDSGPETYLLPLGDQVLFIKNKELYVLREDNDLYYALAINPKGEWKIASIDMTQLSQWEEYRQEIECPGEKAKPTNVFMYYYCKTVMEADTKKILKVRYSQGCFI